MANNINQTILTATNKNIGFKVGTQANLDELRSTNKGNGVGKNGIPGTFYLTGDTHRLYIANDDKTISPVNPGVITVASIEDLPNMRAANITEEMRQATVGNFYYVTGANILCVYSESSQTGNDKGGWVQINPNTDSKVADFEQAVSVTGGVATITSTLTQGENGASEDTITEDFTVSGSGGAKVSANSTTGIIITGEQYSIGSDVASGAATITLTPSDNTYGDNASTVSLAAGNNVTIKKDSNETPNKIVIESKDTINEVSNVTLAPVTNGDGFIVSVTTTNGVSGTTDVTEDDTIDPVITNGDKDGFTAHFSGGTATLNVYSKNQIDDLMRGLDAMHYRGLMGLGAPSDGGILDQATITVSDSILSELAAGQPPKYLDTGDTFKLAGQTKINGVDYAAGSIVIVRGTESDTTGHITSDLVFDVIAGSTEKDTKYQFNNLTDTANPTAPTYSGIQMVEQQNQSAVVGELRITKGTAISLSDSFSSNAKEITINHANITSTATTANGETQNAAGNTTVNVVKSVTVNTQGHVTDVTTVPITLRDSYTLLDSANLAASAITSADPNVTGVSISSTVSGHNSILNDVTTTESGTALTIKSESLEVAVDSTSGANGITMNMVWGSF